MTNNRSNFTSKSDLSLRRQALLSVSETSGVSRIWSHSTAAELFLLCYIILAVTFGFALMTAEIALGRKTRLSAIGAFSA